MEWQVTDEANHGLLGSCEHDSAGLSSSPVSTQGRACHPAKRSGPSSLPRASAIQWLCGSRRPPGRSPALPARPSDQP